MVHNFPPEFLWGVASAAYQIEGAPDTDGKCPSIWDRFTHQTGAVIDGTTGDIACDHYNRYREDVAIMSRLGIRAYRFSISWPRILSGSSVNKKGIDFYNRLIDELLRMGITPYCTLYHWDLPQSCQDDGGWLNRDTAGHFADFAVLVAREFGDRIKHWITLNEPLVAAVWGYGLGIHAPGVRKPYRAARAGHHMLLGHGLAVQALRTEGAEDVGITNALQPIYNYRLDRWSRAADIADALINRFWLDPIFKREYPSELLRHVTRLVGASRLDDDLKVIAQPIDFLGVNNYTRMVVRPSLRPVYRFSPVDPDYPGVRRSDMGWEIYPNGLYELLIRLTDEYGPVPLLVTENGIACRDEVVNEEVHDEDRIAYLDAHIRSVHRAISAGADVRGYFVWTLIDNFEWAEGFTKRFGLVYLDSRTQQRIVKDSGAWYSAVCRRNGVDDSIGAG